MTTALQVVESLEKLTDMSCKCCDEMGRLYGEMGRLQGYANKHTHAPKETIILRGMFISDLLRRIAEADARNQRIRRATERLRDRLEATLMRG